VGSATGALVLVAYAWWVSGLAAFTTRATAAVVVPAVLLLALALVAAPAVRDVGDASGPAVGLRAVTPWLVLAVVAVVLESVGLALGGRSHAVPTLSTVVDHVLSARWSRFVLCGLWLGIGVAGALRLRPSAGRP
jgi:phosphate/sulfate permease